MCHYSYPMLYIYIPDMNTNVTHFTKHMNKMIEAMDTPEASIASLWEMLTSSPWWKAVLITILIVLFLLFAPCICNCVIEFVSTRMKAFKLQMVVQAPTSAKFLQLLLGALGSETLNMRVRRICCLTNLGTTPNKKELWIENEPLFPRQHNSPKRKGGKERVNS